MGDDSPLLTPEDAGDGEQERLLTPEAERTRTVRAGKGGAPAEPPPDPGPGATNGAAVGGAKRKLGVVDESELGRTESALSASSASPWPSAGKYRKIKKVGVGAYGSVFMAENTETKDIVAIKVTTRKEDPILGGFPLSLLREICILRRLKHDSIVQIYEVAQTPQGEPLIVMEYCQSSLQELLNSRKHGLSFSEVKYVIRQILDATHHMHERGILHRDLATKNVLFNISGEIKVCDFGISRVAFGQDQELGFLPGRDLEDPNMIVSLPYRAIELLLGQRDYGPALDVWAAGCIFGEILLCQSGKRRTFFGGEGESPNKTPQMVVEEIFGILGRPTSETWPGLSKLPLHRSLCSTSCRVDRAIAYTEKGQEGLFMRRYFVSGEGKCASSKYALPASCYDLLGGLLTLCPAHRQTAEESLRHSFFSEKPMPEWHAWHWALASSEIPRGKEMRNQTRDEADEARTLLRELSRGNSHLSEATGEMSVKDQTKEALERRANERKRQEERMLAAKRAVEEKAPPGWTKHWSSSRKRYYYHDKKTGRNEWAPDAR